MKEGSVVHTIAAICMIPVFLGLLGCKEETPAPGDSEDPGDSTDTVSYVAPLEGYTLAFEDNFDGPAVDEATWTYRTGNCGIGYCVEEVVSVENGTLKISTQKTETNGRPVNGGGVITRQVYRYGYFETLVKLDSRFGWHEAFWSTSTDDINSPVAVSESLEIDGFEHYTDYGQNKITYGAIEWRPVRRGLHRAYVQSDTLDFSERFYKIAWEITPDYLNFYFEDTLVATMPSAYFPHSENHVWLSSICNVKSEELPQVAQTSSVYFDYFRYYDIDFESETYAKRKAYFASIYGPDYESYPSDGIDLWIEAEKFTRPGGWVTESEGLSTFLKGHTFADPDREDALRTATTAISKIPEAGTYYLWVRSRDYGQGDRTFTVSIAGEEPVDTFGTSSFDGWHWEKGSAFELEEGEITLSIYDKSQYYARCDKLLLTTDPDYVPQNYGGETNVTYLTP